MSVIREHRASGAHAVQYTRTKISPPSRVSRYLSVYTLVAPVARGPAGDMAMLCCVSRKAAAADNKDISRCRASAEFSRFVDACNFRRANLEDDALKRLDEAVHDVAAVANSFSSFKAKLDQLPPETGVYYYQRDFYGVTFLLRVYYEFAFSSSLYSSMIIYSFFICR